MHRVHNNERSGVGSLGPDADALTGAGNLRSSLHAHYGIASAIYLGKISGFLVVRVSSASLERAESAPTAVFWST